MVGMTQSDSQGLEAAVASNGLHKPGLSARNHQSGRGPHSPTLPAEL